jgi:hypothetical protein
MLKILKSVLLFKKHTIYILLKYAFHKNTPHPPPSASASPTRGEAKSSSVLIYSTTPLQGERQKALAFIYSTTTVIVQRKS